MLNAKGNGMGLPTDLKNFHADAPAAVGSRCDGARYSGAPVNDFLTDVASPLLASQYLTLTPASRLRQIVIHWRKVKDDPTVKLPSWFACLLEAASLAQADEEAAGAERGIRKDQRERLEGANDDRHDNVKAGS